MVRVVKKPDERRRDIIDAACQLFLTKGYDSTTMADIMKHLKIAKGTIYHYFRSKEDLLEAVISNVAEGEMERLRGALDAAEGNAIERLEYLIMNGANHDGGDAHEELLGHLHKTSNAGMHIRLLAKLVTIQAPIYAELFRQGCEEGLFETEHPLECAEFLISGIQFLTDMGIYPWAEEQLQRRWAAFPHLVEKQLDAQKGSFGFLHKLVSDNQAK